MKKIFSVLIALVMMASLLTTTVSAAPTITTTPELGQLKVCKVAGSGVTEGTLFTFRVGGTTYNVPAGPDDRRGYCVLAGQYPLNTEVTIEEVIPTGYYVSLIEVRPDSNLVSRTTSQGIVTVEIGSGVTEVSFTNRVIGSPTPTRTPTSVNTSTPRPTRTPTSTPSCAPDCTPTPTPVPMGRLQICKEAEGDGVAGYFTFKFETRSRSVPVGACAGLISVEAGTLTITEVEQTGYSVADIYTIPASRLINKDLIGGSATVQIVEGTVASQTIVVFRNRADAATATFTPTNTQTATATATPTGTVTPPTATFTPTPTVCSPEMITADFSNVQNDQSVEGVAAVAPHLIIDAIGTAKKISSGAAPFVFGAPNTTFATNNGLAASGGFSDVDTRNAVQPHRYTFSFTPEVSVSQFSLHMLDYGDYNPTGSTSSVVTMTAYNVSNGVVEQQVLDFTSLNLQSPEYGDLLISGDAITATPGQPGNWTWNVGGTGIVRIVLEFGAGYDPNIAFDTLTFTTECLVCEPLALAADISNVQNDRSMEGVAVVAPYLIIDAIGTTKRISSGVAPFVFGAPNTTFATNNGLAASGGFSDVDTRNAVQPHRYTFSFTPGVSVSQFSLHMLDYGDFNPSGSTSHVVTMTAYNVSNGVVEQQVLDFTSLNLQSPQYGDLLLSGDAITATPGQPGNWTWNVSGSGIVTVVLEFGAGYDPNIAFDTLTFTTECP
jgi:hypothetical protein